MTSNVAVSISLTNSARPPQAASLSQARAAVALIAGANATTLRWVKIGATA